MMPDGDAELDYLDLANSALVEPAEDDDTSPGCCDEMAGWALEGEEDDEE